MSSGGTAAAQGLGGTDPFPPSSPSLPTLHGQDGEGGEAETKQQVLQRHVSRAGSRGRRGRIYEGSALSRRPTAILCKRPGPSPALPAGPRCRGRPWAAAAPPLSAARPPLRGAPPAARQRPHQQVAASPRWGERSRSLRMGDGRCGASPPAGGSTRQAFIIFSVDF